MTEPDDDFNGVPADYLGPVLNMQAVKEPRAALGLWLLEQGQTDKARRWLRRALALDPADRRTQELEQRLLSLEEEGGLESGGTKEG